MRTILLNLSVIAAAALLGGAVAAEPARLSLVNAFPVSDEYLARWVAAVNESAPDAIVITRQASPSKDQLDQLSLVRDGVVDIALVITNYHPQEFPDDDVAQLPGMFRTATEGSATMWRLYERGLLRGYEEFAVLTIRTSGNSFLHTDFPVSSLDVLSGKRIRVGTTLLAPLPEEFAAEPIFTPIAEVWEGFMNQKLDGVVTVPAALFAGSRIVDVAKFHLMEPLGQFTVALLMNKDRYESLPEGARAVLDAHAGGGLASRWGEQIDEEFRRNLERIVGSPGHVVRSLDEEERTRWIGATRSVVADWIAIDPHHALVVAAAREELGSNIARQRR